MAATCATETQAINPDARALSIARGNSAIAIVERDRRELPVFKFTGSTALEANVLAVFWSKDDKKTSAQQDNSAVANRVMSMAERAASELTSYLTLPKGWDGYKGRPFSEDIIRQGKMIVSAIQKYGVSTGAVPKEITPGPIGDGSLDIEVAHEKKRLVLTLSAAEANVAILTQDAGKSSEDSVELEKLDLEKQLSWLFS